MDMRKFTTSRPTTLAPSATEPGAPWPAGSVVYADVSDAAVTNGRRRVILMINSNTPYWIPDADLELAPPPKVAVVAPKEEPKKDVKKDVKSGFATWKIVAGVAGGAALLGAAGWFFFKRRK